MRYSKSMIEAVKQVSLYEQFDYVLLDKDNKIIARYKGRDAKKHAEINKKGAERKLGVKKPIKVYPINPGDKRKIGDTIIAIGELTDKQRGEIEEGKIEFKQDSKDVISIMKKGKLQGKMKKTPKGWAVVRGGRDFPITGGKNLDVAKDAVRDLFGEETLHEDRKNALAGFDNRIRDAASMDRKDFIKAKELYKRKDVKGLRKHIYSLDTSPLETVMNLISIQDRPFFDKMYPNTRGGEFLARIAYQHRNLDEKLDENKDDEKKRMKGAKLKLKMGEGFASDAQRRAAFAQGYKAKGKKDKKEETLDEAVADLFVKGNNRNQMALQIAKSAKGLGLKSALMGNQVRVKGSKREVNDFMRSVLGKSSMGSPTEKGVSNPQIDKMLNKQLKEDGHTDVSSAIRQCKTVLEDAMQIMGKLKSMSGEDSLPTWWTNKLAVASNSMNKMRDYILVPSMQEQIELDERMKLPRQLIDTNKEVMIVKKNKVIVIDKKDKDKYMRQGWELAEKLDKEDEPKVKEIVKKLKKASDAHAGQAKDLEKAVKETVITSKELLDNKYKEEKNGAQHFSKVNEDNYVWNFVYDDFGRTKLTTEPDKATHLVYTMEGKDNPQLLKLSEREILDYKKGENK